MLVKLREKLAAVIQQYNSHYDRTMSKEFQFITKQNIDNTFICDVGEKLDGNV